MVFDLQQLGRTPVDFNRVPYARRRQMLAEILPLLNEPRFHLAPQVQTSEEAQALWRQIGAGQHPLTREGIVIHPPQGRPLKAKYRPEFDVHITGTYPGEGRRAKTVGGLTYGLEPGGPTIGRVGTGFTDELLDEIARDPRSYTGRVARLRAQEQLPSGALRAPAFGDFIALHEDYPAAKVAAEPRRFSLAEAKRVGDRLGVNWDVISASSFRQGMEIELEHQDVTHGDPLLTGRIAHAHLKERADYYELLDRYVEGAPEPKKAEDVIGERGITAVYDAVILLKQAADKHVCTVAVDLDGTLVEDGEFDPDKIGPPRPGARKWMRKLQEAGARLVVFTVRGDRKLVRDWAHEHDIPIDDVNETIDRADVCIELADVSGNRCGDSGGVSASRL